MPKFVCRKWFRHPKYAMLVIRNKVGIRLNLLKRGDTSVAPRQADCMHMQVLINSAWQS